MAAHSHLNIDDFMTMTEFKHSKIIEAEGIIYKDLPPAVQAVIKDLSVTVEALESVVDALSVENGAPQGMGCLGI